MKSMPPGFEELLTGMSPDVRELNPDVIGGGSGTETEAAQGPPAADGTDTQGKPKRASKWHNVRSEMAGMTFQSGHEAEVIGNLMVAEERRAGVFGLRLQVRFPLPGGKFYDADATYIDGKIQPHVIDAKAFNLKTGKYLLTREFRSKRRQFRELYGHDIELL